MRALSFLFFLICATELMAAPPKKVVAVSQVKISQSYSLALPGLEAESFRLQKLILRDQPSFMAARLVKGALEKEKTLSASDYEKLRQQYGRLLKLKPSEVCDQPLVVKYTQQDKESSRTLCGEKDEVYAEAQVWVEAMKKTLAAP